MGIGTGVVSSEACARAVSVWCVEGERKKVWMLDEAE